MMHINFDVSAFADKLTEEKKNTRMILIARIFEYDKFLGVDTKLLKKSSYYYNDQFDKLYDMNFYELEDFEQQMHQCVATYGRILNRNFFERGGE